MAGVYTIRHGDTLWSIAARNHITLSQLYTWNPEFNPASPYHHGNLVWAGGRVNLGPGGPSQPAKPRGAASAPNTGPGNVPNPRPNIEKTLLQELEGLPGQQRDAYAGIKTLFDSYDLGTLAPLVLRYLQDGFASETITVLLQETPEYRARFSGNDARAQAGLMKLTPAEYLATEASYKQLLQAGGIDPSFSSRTQFSEWIGKDISPTEIQNRVTMAVQATTQADPGVTRAFAQMGFNTGDLASYFLNDKVAPPALQTKLQTAQIMAAGLDNNLPVVADRANIWANRGVTTAQAQGAYQKIANMLPQATKLQQLYPNQPLTSGPQAQTTLEDAFLGQSGGAQLSIENLGRQETAAFQGQGGVGKESFKQQTPGAPGF